MSNRQKAELEGFIDVFNSKEVNLFLLKLSKARTPSDVISSLVVLEGKHSNLVSMVCIDEYNRSAVPFLVNKYTKPPLNYLVPYFSSNYMYFLEESIIQDMVLNKKVNFSIDYTLMFDTNICSYINRLVHGQPLKGVHNKFIAFVDEILQDNLNYDSLYYMVENVKSVIHIIKNKEHSKIEFWNSLNKNFRSNLVSLQLFMSIDCIEYKKTSNPKARFTYREAARKAIDFSYEFYASKEGRKNILDFVIVQKLILLHLIGIVKIQLSSNKSVRNKMIDYFNFVHYVMGIYFAREAVIAHKYFQDRRDVSILNSIQRGMSTKGLLKKLDNIAWDMAAPKYMEKLIASSKELGDSKFFIPMFVTFDNDLRNLLSLYPVKGVVYCKKTGATMSLPETIADDYFRENGLEQEFLELHKEEFKTNRIVRGKPKYSNVINSIKSEYRELRKILK